MTTDELIEELKKYPGKKVTIGYTVESFELRDFEQSVSLYPTKGQSIGLTV